VRRLATAAAAVLLLTAGCGGDDQQERTPRGAEDAVKAYYDAFADGDPDACEFETAEYSEQANAALAAFSDDEDAADLTCPARIKRSVALMEAFDVDLSEAEFEAQEEDATEDSIQVVVSYPDDDPETYTVVYEDGRWLIDADDSSPATGEGDQGSSGSSADSSDDGMVDQEAPQGQIVDSGFGQNGSSAHAVVLVKNTADHGGQMVTVSVNFLDASGKILATESQIDSFNVEGQTIATQVDAFDLGRAKVASIEPTLLVKDEGTFNETDYDLGTVKGTNIKRQYGAWTGDFIVENPTAEAIESPAVRVACRDSAGVINGGGYTFPDLVPPNGQVVADVGLTLGSKPSSCTAYIGGPIF
jgi:hypothetical protein